MQQIIGKQKMIQHCIFIHIKGYYDEQYWPYQLIKNSKIGNYHSRDTEQR